MKLYESTYYTFTLEGDTIINRWSANTADMSYQDFKDALMNLAGYIIEHKSKKILIDITSFQFALPSENVAFRNEEFYPRITKVGARRQALIMPEEYLAYVQDEVAETDVVQTRYFAREAEAIDWLSR
jgi:GR25 family glycosyltransferase involved in LPS biosynthesis